MLFNPVKRALRNGIFLSIAVGIIVGWQGETIQNALLSTLFTFAIITPAFWLSYKWANKLAAKHREPNND
jgi:ABC-type dipeptide/oligopeptide/nickel transport system permease component